MIRAVLFDRDGVLNIDEVNVCTADRFTWIEDAPATIKMLNDAGILTLVVTNQSGIARGLFSEDQFNGFMEWIQGELRESGAHLDGIYMCPHHPTAGQGIYLKDCDCRKPKSGMVLQALKDHGLQPDEAIMIGDMPRDVLAAEGAGVKGFIFEGGNLLKFVQNALAGVEASRPSVK